jgi:DNA-binding transcriptional MerR regulator
MRRFSIKELERFSGIKAHTIRIWENRYTVLTPTRTAGNIRNYSIDEVKTLLDIGLLSRNGHKISTLVKLNTDELESRKASLLTNEAKQERSIHTLICCMFTRNIDDLDEHLDSCVDTWGIDTTIQNIIIPFLEKVDILSYKDGSPEVHFAVTSVRKKLILGIETVKNHQPGMKTALMFLPKGEHFDLVLLYMTYMIKQKGLRILYLGTNVSKDNLQQVIADKRPHYIFTYIPKGDLFHTTPLTNFLEANMPDTKLCVAEAEQVNRKFNDDQVHYFHYKDVESAITFYAIL